MQKDLTVERRKRRNPDCPRSDYYHDNYARNAERKREAARRRYYLGLLKAIDEFKSREEVKPKRRRIIWQGGSEAEAKRWLAKHRLPLSLKRCEAGIIQAAIPGTDEEVTIERASDVTCHYGELRVMNSSGETMKFEIF